MMRSGLWSGNGEGIALRQGEAQSTVQSSLARLEPATSPTLDVGFAEPWQAGGYTPLLELAETPARRRGWYVRLTLFLSDLFALVLAFFLSERLLGLTPTDAAGSVSLPGLLFLTTLPGWILLIKLAGLYSADDELINHSTVDEVGRLFQAATLGVWLYVGLAWLSHVQFPEYRQLLFFWLLAALLLPVVRAAARSEFRRDPDYPQNTVIVGAGDVGQRLARKFMHHPEYKIRLLGLVDAMPKERGDDLEHLTLLGRPEELPALVDEYRVERVIVAFSSESHEAMMDVIRDLQDRGVVRIDIVPRLFDILPPELARNSVEGIPLLAAPRMHLSRSAKVAKRALDLVLSIAALLVLSPFLLLMALLIKLDSPGPAMFTQLRMGFGERPFRMYKFRTMARDAEERKLEVAHLNDHARPGGDPRMFKIRSDPRVTRVGGFLRRYSLDEVPQLLNVLKGEMSLIGPRPLILEEDQFIERWARKRLLLKPGMTGLWQVVGRSSIPFEEMVRLDYLYVTNWSLARDVRILLRTIPSVLRGERPGIA
jgi:exopolysaccharide biosynthesis polyprenyl glycosylphosphotransferase